MTFDNSIPTPPPTPRGGHAPHSPLSTGPDLPTPADTPPAPAKRNVLGLVSLILAVVGFVIAIVPLLGVVGWPLLIAALVLGIIGLTRKGQPKGTSIAGLALSLLAMILAPIIAVAILAGSVDDTAKTVPDTSTSTTTDDADAPSDDTPAEPADDPAEEQAAQEPASDAITPLGTAADVDGMAMTITKVETGVDRIGDQYLGEDAQGQFVLVHLTVQNTGTKPDSFNALAVKVYDQDGREFSANSAAAIYLKDGSVLFEEVNPGNTLTGTVVFDLPAGAVPATFEYDPLFGSKAVLALM